MWISSFNSGKENEEGEENTASGCKLGRQQKSAEERFSVKVGGKREK